MYATIAQNKHWPYAKVFLASISIALAVFSGLHAPKARADGAILYISPAASSHAVGEKFSVALRVNTGGVAINAGEATLSFDPDALEVVSVSKAGSVYSLWPNEPKFSNDSGSMTFSGGVPSPGFNGEAGLLLSATLRIKKAGIASLRYVSGAMLANDGNGTNILTSSRNGSFTSSGKPTYSLKPGTHTATPSSPVIFSPSHPVDSASLGTAAWSANNDPEFDWKSDPDANSFSWELDQNPETIPDSISEGSLISKAYTDVEDGIWFFHLRTQNSGGWSNASHYEIRVDATPPESFNIEIIGGRDLTDPTPLVRFGTKDVMGGVDYYAVRVGAGEAQRILPDAVSDPLALALLAPGTYAVQVIAYDRAGNSRDAYAEFTIHALEPPVITSYSKTIAADEAVFVEGKAPPGLQVVLTIERPDGSKQISWEVPVNQKGDWTFLMMQYLSSGVWHLSVQTKNMEGAVSLTKAEVDVEVLPVAIRVGSLHLTYASAYGVGGVFAAGILTLIGGIVVVYRKKFRRLHRTVLKEVAEAERALHVGFRTLREDIIQELRNLDALQKIRPLVPEELARREKLLKDLALIEFRITKEVQDIERALEGQEISAGDVLPEPPSPPRN